MLGPDRIAFHGQDERSRDPAEAGDQEKSTCMHGAQAQQVTKKILGQPGDEEEDKRKKGTMAFYQVFEFAERLLVQKTAHKGQAQAPGDQKGKKRTQREAHRGVDQARDGSEQIPSDEAGEIAGNRCREDLQDLQSYENQGGIRTEGKYKPVYPLFIIKKVPRLSKPQVNLPVIIDEQADTQERQAIGKERWPLFPEVFHFLSVLRRSQAEAGCLQAHTAEAQGPAKNGTLKCRYFTVTELRGVSEGKSFGKIGLSGRVNSIVRVFIS
jgi:hypothetical protein